MNGVRVSARNSVEGFRGRAMNAWRSGVNSIDLFNFFVMPGQPHFALLKELDDPKKLAWLDKLYVPDPLGNGRAGRWLKDGDRFFTRPVFAAGPLTPGQTTTVQILVGDDVSAAAAHRRRVAVTLDVVTHGGSPAPRDLDVRLNGKTLTAGGATLTYVVDPPTVKVGYNEITLTLATGAKVKSDLEDLRLWIRYQSPQ